jgi:hypothetical protein
MSAREQYLHERRLKAGEPIDAYHQPPDNDLPTWGEILGGLALMFGLALGLWLLSFAVPALRGLP